LPPSSRYADARCAGQWAWSRRFRKAVAIQPLNALTGHGCINIATGREGGAVRKTIAVLGSALFFAVAPLVLAGFVPWWVTQWEFRPAFFGVDLTRILGGMLIIVGVPGLVDSFARFALQGLGTPAPIAPTQNLVVTGLYRYVRNPIYIAVVAVIFGQALLFGDWRLLWYGALLWLFFHVWVVMIEEPTLKQTFGTEYESFRTNVPRWIPRLTPWRVP
jgi:protein-S-isoprenylcysteine O-methyltransferase Ste14